MVANAFTTCRAISVLSMLWFVRCKITRRIRPYMLFIGNFEHRRGDQFHFALESTDCNPLDFFSTRFKYESVQNAVEKLTKDRTRSVRLKTENEIGDPLWLVITFSL